MKIANSYENCKRPHRNYTLKHENCKLIWKLQTDMKIELWYENCKAILTFWHLVCMWTLAIFIWDKAGMKTCSGTERMFWFDCGVDDKNTTKQSLAKPSTIHILIPIPMLTHSDSYFKKWFLCSVCISLVWLDDVCSTHHLCVGLNRQSHMWLVCTSNLPYLESMMWHWQLL